MKEKRCLGTLGATQTLATADLAAVPLLVTARTIYSAALGHILITSLTRPTATLATTVASATQRPETVHHDAALQVVHAPPHLPAVSTNTRITTAIIGSIIL